MKKLAAVFVIAVLAPAVALAWLATRSLRDQELVVHSQQALIQQGATDALANDLNLFLDEIRVFYGSLLEKLIAEMGPEPLAAEFDEIIRSRWSQAAVGAALTEQGTWLNPPLTSAEPAIQRFLDDTRPFLMNAASYDVYLAPATTGRVVTVEPENDPNRSNRARFFSISRQGLVAEAPSDTPIESTTRSAMPSGTVGLLDLEKEKAAALDSVQEPAPAAAAPSPPMAIAREERKVAPSGEIERDLVAEEAGAPESSPYLQQAVQQKVAAADGLVRSRSISDRESAGKNVGRSAPSFSKQEGAAEAESVAIQAEAQIAGAGGGGGGLASAPEAILSESLPEDPSQRIRNVRPLGQLAQSEQGASFSRFAQAATEALADNPNRLAFSNLDVNSGELRDLMADDPEGAISRFVSGGLQVLLWRKDPAAPGKVFWVQLDLEELRSDLSEIVRESGRGSETQASLALLDAGGEVVAQTVEGFQTDWQQPFVATEVGEILPHWEVAAYLLDPRAVARSARSARLVLWMLIPFLLTAIGIGGFLLMRDVSREMRLARQKTDFVSNVSHELKTPLTSIRMFSDLLGNRPELAEEKRREYSGIISRESARLSRLINNLLDFSRMERGEKRYRKEPIAVRAFLAETLETCRHQIESDGFDLSFDCPDSDGEGNPPTLLGDRDALAQVLLNLLSNAEKYGGDRREIGVELTCHDGEARISVLDRGAGISRKQAEKIFEKFYRADDSLSSGIEGSGLGLTLARQIARAHGGNVEYHPREGGGSRFVLTLPLLPSR